MNLPKFIITMDGYIRLGMGDQHKHLLKPGDQCIGGGYYTFDFVSIWRTQDENRTIVNAVLGECIWNLAYDERRTAIVLELSVTLEEDTISDLCCQFLKLH